MKSFAFIGPVTQPVQPAELLPFADLACETVLCIQLLVQRPTAAVTTYAPE